MSTPSQVTTPTKKFFDALIIVPLEEEFEEVIQHFQTLENLSLPDQVMFSAIVPGTPLTVILAQQIKMGKTANTDTCFKCLDSIDTGLLVCLGICGGLSSDISIGDVCYTLELIDVTDNAKIFEARKSVADIALSPYTYHSPPEIAVAFTTYKTIPPGKEKYANWREKCERQARKQIPDQFPEKMVLKLS
jgi:nucleoside phosphorylase